MTIGEMNYDWSQGANPDFIVSIKFFFNCFSDSRIHHCGPYWYMYICTCIFFLTNY